LAPHLNEAQRTDLIAALTPKDQEAEEEDEDDEEDKQQAAVTAALTVKGAPQRAADFAAAKAIGDRIARAHALAALLPHLKDYQRIDAVAAAFGAANAAAYKEDKWRILAALAPHLNLVQRAEALAAVLAEIGKSSCITLAALASCLNRAQLADAFATANAAHDEPKFFAVAALAPYLDPVQRADAAAVVLANAKEDYFGAMHGGMDWDRSFAFSAMARYFDPAQLAEALTIATKTIQDPSYQVSALAALAPNLSRAQLAGSLPPVLNEIREMRQWYSLSYLAEVAPHLDPAGRARALTAPFTAVLNDIRSNSQILSSNISAFRALAALVPYLDATQRGDAVLAVSGIRDLSIRFQALSAMSSQFSGADSVALMKVLLDAVSDVRRHDVLSALSEAVAEIGRLGGPAAIADLYRAILDVSRWYP
jgi:hypothetical protein